MITPNDPADKHSSESVESHESGIDRPLMLHPTGVQNDQAGDTLQRDQRTRGHLPSIVTWLQPWRSDWVDRSCSAGGCDGRLCCCSGCCSHCRCHGAGTWRMEVGGEGNKQTKLTYPGGRLSRRELGKVAGHATIYRSTLLLFQGRGLDRSP